MLPRELRFFSGRFAARLHERRVSLFLSRARAGPLIRATYGFSRGETRERDLSALSLSPRNRARALCRLPASKLQKRAHKWRKRTRRRVERAVLSRDYFVRSFVFHTSAWTCLRSRCRLGNMLFHLRLTTRTHTPIHSPANTHTHTRAQEA